MDYNDFRYSSLNYHLYTFQPSQPQSQSSQPQPQPQQTSYTGMYTMRNPSQAASRLSQQIFRNPVPSVSVKVINPSKKSDTRLFILRNVELQKLKTPESMKNLLLSQLGQESFEMGYFQGNERVWVRNEDDIQEVVKLLRSKDNHCVTLWCMGKSQASKRVLELSDSESDEEVGIKSKSKQRKKCSKYTEKLERIDDTVDELKCKHGSAYNAIQYRVWAETIDAGHHDSLENPPKGSFFKSQGRKGNSRASTPPASSPVVQVLQSKQH